MLQVLFDVTMTRIPRQKCPACGNRRVLYRLSATGNGGLVGHGVAACAACAGMRGKA